MTVDPVWFYYHDFFNLVTLPGICLLNIYYLLWDDNQYYPQYTAFFIYLLVDTTWLVVKPNSVASAASVLPHHLICIVGWNIPTLIDMSYAHFISIGVLVEINTFFLIARRNWRSNIFLELGFYVSWFAIRCVVYPVCWIIVVRRYLAECSKDPSLGESCINAGILVILLFTFLNFLNFKWTFDLLRKLLVNKKRAENHVL